MVFGAALALALTPAAWAHVTVQPTEAPAGSFYKFVVRVPNERPDASTVKVEVKFPETLAFVSFQPKPGWDRTVRMKRLEQPIEVHGEQITEVVDTVVWEGGRIGPGEFDEFGFSARVPEESGILEFPAIQTYDSGEVVRWIGAPDSDEPAGRVRVVDIFEEGQGELSLLAELKREVAADGSGGQVSGSDAGTSPVVVAGSALAGAILGAGVAALVRRR